MTGSICNNHKDINYNEEILDLLKTKPKRRHENRQLKLFISDIIISSIVISPCVVGFWRGLWMLMDFYQHYFPIWESYLLANYIGLLLCLLQDYLNEIVNNQQLSNCYYLIITRIYLYVNAFFNVMAWRGIWSIIDRQLTSIISPDNNHNIRAKCVLIILIASLFIMFLTKTVNNLCGAPFIVSLDRKDDIFTVGTRFKRKMDERLSLYILDCLFSVLIVGTLVVFVWRGAWALVDIYLFPNDETLSAWGSMIVGYTTVIITFTLQPLMKWLCDRLNGLLRLLVADCFFLFSLIGTVNVWRGIWMLLNLYLLPDNLELSCWLTHWICLIILILLGCSNSLLVRGVYIDCEEPGGQCVVFPCYYLRIILEKKQQRHEQQQQQQQQQELNEMNQSNEINHHININDELTTTINHDCSHCKEDV